MRRLKFWIEASRYYITSDLRPTSFPERKKLVQIPPLFEKNSSNCEQKLVLLNHYGPHKVKGRHYELVKIELRKWNSVSLSEK